MTDKQRAMSRMVDARADVMRAEKAAEVAAAAIKRALDEQADAVDAYLAIVERNLA